MIKDARARQHRQRRAAGTVVAAAIAAGALAFGLTGGGNGRIPPVRGHARHGNPGAAASGHTGGHGFAGAPQSQAGSNDWAESAMCPPARRSHYLPAHTGCVTTFRAEVFGNGQQDLVITYSTLLQPGSHFPSGSEDVMYPAKRGFLEVVRPDGRRLITPVSPPANAHAHVQQLGAAVSVLAVSNIGGPPGVKIFLQNGGISSGQYGAIYDSYHGRIMHAGDFSYGGDSGVQAMIDCPPGHPGRLVQTALLAPGPLIGVWKGSRTTYRWRNGRLAKLNSQKIRIHNTTTGLPIAPSIGVGCLTGLGTYRTAGGRLTQPVAITPAKPVSIPKRDGVARGGFIETAAALDGTVYGAGDFEPDLENRAKPVKGPLSRCVSSCAPVIWTYNRALKRWRLTFVNHRTASFPAQLIAYDGALLDFNTSPGTQLLRSTNGRTWTPVKLPAAMASGNLGEVYRAGGSLVAIITGGTERRYHDVNPVWTSTNGTQWAQAQPVAGSP